MADGKKQNRKEKTVNKKPEDFVKADTKAIRKIFEILSKNCPEPKTELKSVNTYTLLVAVMLSAQMTDKGVNKATPELFAIADSPEKMTALGEEKLKGYISSVNLYPTKAKRIIETSKILTERFGGEVPSTREDLESLPGVGRKTANVILNCAFGKPVMPVDTHILRVSYRLGLSENRTPRGVEEDLMKIIPEKYLKDAHHLLLLHGRYVCTARTQKCETCILCSVCPKNQEPKETK